MPPTPLPMDRRDALKATGALLGAALATSAGALSTGTLTACAPAPRAIPGRVLTVEDQALAAEIADTLLPATAASPGAKAAGAGPAINLLLTDCYEPEAQRRVVQGLQDFRATCRDRTGRDFAALPPREREQWLRALDAEAHKAGAAHYFGLVRELAERAYFSSEVGMTRALRYVLTPGRWDGCVPLAPGQPAWG